MNYPGRKIKAGEQDATIVRAVKERLNQVLNLTGSADGRLDPADPNFGPKMTKLVKYFQARNVDGEGRPLVQDGEIGPLTWAALFGADRVPTSDKAATTFLAKVLVIAAEEEAKQVREVPVNSNRGLQVEQYQKRVGASPGDPWCCAFVYWCCDEAAKALGQKNPMVKTAGCLDHWNRAKSAGATRVPAAAAKNDPGLVRPGMIFIMDHGSGKGHTGLVESVKGGLLTTIEGNTDASKTREGGGVYRLVRKVGEINKGFIDYSVV